MIVINHRSAPIRKERLIPTSKPRREASPNKFVEKGGMPDRVKSLKKSIVDRIVRIPAWVYQTHPKWTEKGTEFDQVWTVQGGNWPGGEREWN